MEFSFLKSVPFVPNPGKIEGLRMNRRLSVGDEYRYALCDLTFNSKPIINNLTLFAHEQVAYAAILGRVLCDHLVTCHPDVKLPALYLIDSICKNIGGPYIGVFASLLPTALPEAYRQVRDEVTRRDFGRTLETWWRIFPEPLVRELMNRTVGTLVLGRRGREQEHSQHEPDRRRPPQPFPTERHVPPPHQQPPHHHPYPPVYVRPTLTSYVPGQSPPIAVTRLLEELRAAVTVTPAQYNEKYVAELMYRLEQATRPDPMLFRATDERARLADKRPLVDLIDSVIHPRTAQVKSPVIPHPSAVPTPVQDPLAALLSPDVSPLLASLSSFPINFSNFNIPPTNSSSIKIRPVYEEIIKIRPNAYQAIYGDLARQCTNCGLRFPDTEEGRIKLEAHLDAHFRRNIRLKDKAKKILARLWLQGEQDWIKNVEAKESDRPAMLFSTGGAVENITEMDNGPKPRVPAGSDHTDRLCPICQEKIEVVWDDDADEWMYNDAVTATDGAIMHASCAKKRKNDDRQVVLYNEDEKRVVVQAPSSSERGEAQRIIIKGPTDVAPQPKISICSLCKRPLDTNTTFMDRNYFRFLDSTLRSEHSDSDDDDDDGGGGDDDDDDDVLAGIRNIQRSAFNQGYYAHFFREGRKLGRGARGSVFLAQHILQNELLGEYAVKKVPVGDDAGWLARMLREVHVMESLRHPNTVIYKHTWLEVAQLTVFGPPVPCLFILMEYANGGNLEEFIEAEVIGVNDVRGGGKKSDEPNLLPIDEVLAVFLGICRGLEHLHRFGIIHRDLKPSNILLHYHQQDRVTRPDVLLSDFGECNEIAAEHGRSRTGATGTIEFCAPELFRCNEQGYYYVEHSTMTDVWSLGMILYFLLFGGRLPYADIEDVDVLRNDMLAMERVVLPGTRKDVPLEIIGLLQRLLSTGPEERPSATQAVRTVEVSLLRQAEKRSRSPSRSPLLIAAPREAKKHGIQRKLVVPEWPLYAGVVCLLCGVCYPKSASWILMVIAVICFVIRKHLQSSLLLSMTICIIAGGILYAINGSICAC